MQHPLAASSQWTWIYGQVQVQVQVRADSIDGAEAAAVVEVII